MSVYILVMNHATTHYNPGDIAGVFLLPKDAEEYRAQHALPAAIHRYELCDGDGNYVVGHFALDRLPGMVDMGSSPDPSAKGPY